MKTVISMYMDADVAGELKVRAEAAGAPIGDVAALLIRYGLQKVTPEALRQWAAKRTAARTATNALTKNERLALAAIERLKATGDGAWRFGLNEIANESSLRPAEAYAALKSLKVRGTVVGAESPELDRWDRPVESIWGLAKDRDAAEARRSAAGSDGAA